MKQRSRLPVIPSQGTYEAKRSIAGRVLDGKMMTVKTHARLRHYRLFQKASLPLKRVTYTTFSTSVETM